MKMEYRELLNEIAARTHLPEQTVRLIVETMSEVIVEELTARKNVILRLFGAFHIKSRYSALANGNVWSVRFKLASVAKQIIKKGNSMEKYGVVTTEDKNKTASVRFLFEKKCPKCGKALTTESNTPHCPDCGTEPFEKSEK
jgi:hypothetical protein